MPSPSPRSLLITTTGVRVRSTAWLIGAAVIGAAGCDGCARCAVAPPPTVSAPPARDATLPPLPTAARDDWMNRRIQRILQRQRAELDATPRRTRRWTLVPADDRAASDDTPLAPAAQATGADAGRPQGLAPIVAQRHPRDPALEQRLRRELDETLAEIARVEALSLSVQARVQSGDDFAALQAELRRIEGELRGLRALQRTLRDELLSLQGR